MPIQVVDVFAGPGGLNEGFASYSAGADRPFSIALSIERDPVACETLTLRSAFRTVQSDTGLLSGRYLDAMRSGKYLDRLADDAVFGSAIRLARSHTREFTLDAATRSVSDVLISDAVSGSDPWILVGGPPCQLYSLAGRSRASRLPGFKDDVRHVLYKEYLHILQRHQPAVFVMENVKGMLSAMHHDGRIFDLIRADIAAAGYQLRSLVVEGDDLAPLDFVIRSNSFGVPQKRHRVILLGVRNDICSKRSKVLAPSADVDVQAAIGEMPPLRSRISPVRRDDLSTWIDQRNFGLKEAGRIEPFGQPVDSFGGGFVGCRTSDGEPSLFNHFVRRPELEGFAQHEARSHMASDVSRYAFYSQKMLGGTKWKVNDLPTVLLPAHRNVGRPDTPFTDRFRVQGWNEPSTTIVSHISKDGHYFIHPDPLQARSLTVREAARLQSFPDDYLFSGNRTEQYHQVGNAVPPLLARQVAEIVHGLLS